MNNGSRIETHASSDVLIVIAAHACRGIGIVSENTQCWRKIVGDLHGSESV